MKCRKFTLFLAVHRARVTEEKEDKTRRKQNMPDPLYDFLDTLRGALDGKTFVKLSLSHYKGSDKDLKNIYVRPVTIKRENKLGFTYRYKTRDITKNYSIEDGLAIIAQNLKDSFEGATLLSTKFDLTLDKGKLKKAPPSQITAPDASHDRAKTRLIEAKGVHYLHALKITDAKGEVYKNAQDKFRQINKYAEIMAPLLKDFAPEHTIKIVDIGAGKGYLTFALYDYLQNQGQPAAITGVEFREDLVNICNTIARESGFSGLHFEKVSAGDYDCTGTDVIIALHACDTATDDAIAKGVAAGSRVIVVAPCCHKQIRREMEKSAQNSDAAFMLEHGIYRERMGEMITDSLRGMMLEYHGYTVKIFEFISSEHTAKNIIITAVKKPDAAKRPEILDKIKAAKEAFGIQDHYLEKFLLPHE